MAGHDFVFTVRLSRTGGAGDVDEMLRALTDGLLTHAGCGADVVAEIAAGVRAGLANGAGDGLVEFRAHAGELEVVVSHGNRQVFRTSRRLPE